MYLRLVRFGFASISGTLPRTKDIRHLVHVQFTEAGVTGARGEETMKKNCRTDQPRIFDGRIITSDEIERTHKEVLSSSVFEAVFDPMRELIEDLWLDRLYKLPPKEMH